MSLQIAMSAAERTAVRVFRSSEDLAAAVGEHVGDSAWIEMPQVRINQFAEATGDHQWIHMDPERASTGPFGSTIAHGFLVLSLSARTFMQARRSTPSSTRPTASRC
jgi:acyl dehydratase